MEENWNLTRLVSASEGYRTPKIAIVHDWLTTYGGAEKVLLQMLGCFPDADLFCTLQYLPDKRRNEFPEHIRTTFIQRLPFSKKHYWYYAPLMPIAFEQLDLAEYDIILSSSHTFAKSIIAHPNQLHISYIHSSPRFIWDLQNDYYRNFSFQRGPKRWLASLVFHYLRLCDQRANTGVDIMIANSKYITRRILKCYRREATHIYPGIDTDFFSPDGAKEDYYLTGSFMNPFKKIDLVIESFNKMPDKKLVVFGSGPQQNYLKKIAGKNITFLGYVDDHHLRSLLQKARAFVFSATEDFGMIMAEAQAAGTPVVAFGKGGATEIIRDLNETNDKATGVLFSELTTDAICNAILKFENNMHLITPSNCRENAMRFDKNEFTERLNALVQQEWKKWLSYLDN